MINPHILRNARCVIVLLAGLSSWLPVDRPLTAATPESPRDIVLVYTNWGPWRQEAFLPLVGYLDPQGKAKDWFYDGFLLNRNGLPFSRQETTIGATNRRDWEYFLDQFFKPGQEAEALDSAVERTARELGTPPRPAWVIAMIPYPSPKQQDFGDVDGHGVSENLVDDGARLKVVRWFIDAFLQRWQARAFPHLRFWGFYWMNESIAPEAEPVVRGTAERIHARGHRFLWIPYCFAPGVDKVRDLGFDLVTMQPNYAFVRPTHSGNVGNENRLSWAAKKSRELGMGLEMEFFGAITSPAHRANARLYLDHGDPSLDGYCDRPRTWYHGYNHLAEFCRSSHPAVRQLYDDMYAFHQGTYRREGLYQRLATPTVAGATRGRSACLVDGLWNTRADRPRETLTLTGPAILDFDLGAGRLVGDVRVHFTGPGAECSAAVVTIATAGDVEGGPFGPASVSDPVIFLDDEVGGFAIASCPLRRARRLRLTIELPPGRAATIDEVLLMPAANHLWGEAYQASDAVGDGIQLTDGRVGEGRTTSWPGRGRVSFELGELRLVSSVEVHFVRARPKGFAPQLSVEASGGQSPAVIRGSPCRVVGDEGWASVSLNRFVDRLVLDVDDPSAGAVAIDEVALLPGENLASECSYTFDPPLPATFPDDGRKLTNGHTGNGALDAVGWLNAVAGGETWMDTSRVTVVLDLGSTTPVDAVRVHVLNAGYSNTAPPRQMVTRVSEDGISWTLPSAMPRTPKTTERAANAKCDPAWLDVPVGGIRGRYVQVQLWPEGLLLVDEICVMAAGKNVALERPYTTLPRPSAFWKPLADACGKLTDGFHISAKSSTIPDSISWWGPCASFCAIPENASTITADLLSPRRVEVARLHLIRSGAGHGFPSELAVSTSLDGNTWTPAGTTSAHSGSAIGTMTVAFAPCTTRYVRFALKSSNVPVCLSQIELFAAHPY